MSWTRAHLALGANLGEPEAMLHTAIARLSCEVIRVVRIARLYKSAPVGPPGQPEYLNTAVEIQTSLEPEALLEHLKALEAELGRRPGMHWGPRLIDLDIILFGTRVVDLPHLKIPHEHMHWRRFVLAPLADIAHDVLVPKHDRTVQELLAGLEDDPGTVQAVTSAA